MPQSYARLNYHLVFATRKREPTITTDIKQPVYDFIGKVLKARDCRLLEAGGVEDHTHLLVDISRERSLAETLRDVKAVSSGWVRRAYPDHRDFGWQRGYGAFTVGYSETKYVRDYIQRQEAHHHRASFESEFRALLDSHGIEYSEEYLWG